MEIILLLLFPLFIIGGSRLEWKLNQWLFIDLYIGRKNFYNFYKNNKTTIDNMI